MPTYHFTQRIWLSASFGVGRDPEANPAWIGGTRELLTLSMIYLASLFNGHLPPYRSQTRSCLGSSLPSLLLNIKRISRTWSFPQDECCLARTLPGLLSAQVIPALWTSPFLCVSQSCRIAIAWPPAGLMGQQVLEIQKDLLYDPRSCSR